MMINEKSEKEAEQLQNKFLKWYEEWSKLAVTKTAFNSLESIMGKQGERTKNSIVMACYNAAHYKESDDEGVNYRKQIVLEKSKVGSLSRAAHILSRSAKADDKALGWANIYAELESGVRITRLNHDESKAQHLVMYDYFLSLEKMLNGKLLELDGGPFYYKCTVGNLTFDKEISRGRRIRAETMLGFEIAFYLRLYTAGRENDCIQNGQKMPEDGEPNFPTVALFCESVFLDNSYDAKQIGDKVRDINHARLSTKWQGVNSL